MARPRKTDEAKILEGNFQPSKARDKAPKSPKLEATDPPDRIKGKVRREAWKMLAEQLDAMGMLFQADMAMFEMLVEAYTNWREASGKAKVGVMQSNSGYVYPNPMIGVARGYRKDFCEMASHFGLSPSSRMGLEVPAIPMRMVGNGTTVTAKVVERQKLMEQFDIDE
jgi:P27 family predicted phage terminase small subunit